LKYSNLFISFKLPTTKKTFVGPNIRKKKKRKKTKIFIKKFYLPPTLPIKKENLRTLLTNEMGTRTVFQHDYRLVSSSPLPRGKKRSSWAPPPFGSRLLKRRSINKGWQVVMVKLRPPHFVEVQKGQVVMIGSWVSPSISYHSGHWYGIERDFMAKKVDSDLLMDRLTETQALYGCGEKEVSLRVVP